MDKGTALAHGDFQRFRDLVMERSGLYFAENKQQMLERGLMEALNGSTCGGLDEYYRLLRGSPSAHPEWERLVSLLTVGETYFLRNRGHFGALAEKVFPEIISQQQDSSRRLRIWSAGCASGEEPYSVAIVLRELIPQIDRWNILILATDINRAALRAARQGIYGAWSFRGVEKRVQERYFRRDANERYHISDDVKRMVTFDYLNLIEDPYPSLSNNTHGLDIILCRNVTIYFRPEVTQAVVRRLHQCLVNGGWLVPGPSEPNMVTYGDFEQRSFPGAVLYRKPASPRAPHIAPLFQAAPSASAKVAPAQPRPAAPAQTMAKQLVPAPGAAARLESPQAEPDLYAFGLALLEAGRADEALAKFQAAAEKDPRSAAACFALCRIHANRGSLEEAQRWCERAIQNDRLLTPAYFMLSMIYQEQGLSDKAVDALKKTIYLDQGFVLAHYNLAHLYRRQGDEASARRALLTVQRLLEPKARNEPIPEGDGLVAGRLLVQVQAQLGTGTQ
jgi:chemotaxis protein methyltransferase CheR